MFRVILFLTRPFRYWFDRLTFNCFVKNNEIIELKDKFLGKPILVVGNGPSLNKTPLNEFIDIPSIGMNKIDLLFERVDWRPSFIITVNNLVVKQHWERFNKLDIPVFLSWKCRYFLPKKIRGKFQYFLSRASNSFSTEIPYWVGNSDTVTYPALQFAYYMGGNPVIIFGVDHSFSFKGKANDIAKRKGKDVNHFDPNYFKEGQMWGLPNLKNSEIAYQIAYERFKDSGREIYDATIGGKLHIFPKISVEEAKRLCGLIN